MSQATESDTQTPTVPMSQALACFQHWGVSPGADIIRAEIKECGSKSETETQGGWSGSLAESLKTLLTSNNIKHIRKKKPHGLIHEVIRNLEPRCSAESVIHLSAAINVVLKLISTTHTLFTSASQTHKLMQSKMSTYTQFGNKEETKAALEQRAAFMGKLKDVFRQDAETVKERVQLREQALDAKRNKVMFFKETEIKELFQKERATPGEALFWLSCRIGCRTGEILNSSTFQPLSHVTELTKAQRLRAEWWETIGIKKEDLVLQSNPAAKGASASKKGALEAVVKPFYSPPWMEQSGSQCSGAEEFCDRLQALREVLKENPILCKPATLKEAAERITGSDVTFRLGRSLYPALLYWTYGVKNGLEYGMLAKRALGHAVDTSAPTYMCVKIVRDGEEVPDGLNRPPAKKRKSEETQEKGGKKQREMKQEIVFNRDIPEPSTGTVGEVSVRRVFGAEKKVDDTFKQKAQELAAAGVKPTHNRMRQLGFSTSRCTECIKSSPDWWDALLSAFNSAKAYQRKGHGIRGTEARDVTLVY